MIQKKFFLHLAIDSLSGRQRSQLLRHSSRQGRPPEASADAGQLGHQQASRHRGRRRKFARHVLTDKVWFFF